LDKAVWFRPFIPDIADEKEFNLIYNAIQKNIMVEFSYKKLAANKPMVRHVRPYCLICVENHWYLIGFDELRQGMRTFSFQG
jgi:predicted DNA-binding transcriptional regulator YafY